MEKDDNHVTFRLIIMYNHVIFLCFLSHSVAQQMNTIALCFVGTHHTVCEHQTIQVGSQVASSQVGVAGTKQNLQAPWERHPVVRKTPAACCRSLLGHSEPLAGATAACAQTSTMEQPWNGTLKEFLQMTPDTLGTSGIQWWFHVG